MNHLPSRLIFSGKKKKKKKKKMSSTANLLRVVKVNFKNGEIIFIKFIWLLLSVMVK